MDSHPAGLAGAGGPHFLICLSFITVTVVLGALEFPLTPADLAQIEHAVPVGAAAGDRYPAVSMARLDSERS